MNIRRYTFFLLVILVFSGCRGCRDDDSVVPLVSVDFTMNIGEPEFFNLTNITGWVYVTGGSRGIIVYRNNLNQFTAFDRHSPHNVSEGCRVAVLEDNITIKDECSESTWLIIDGSVISGPTTQGLKQYNTQFSGTILRVFN